MIDPHKPKYFELYWDIAWSAASSSNAMRHRVGAIVVTSTGMISLGWNGMPAGLTNTCEDRVVEEPDGTVRLKTDPRVIHAERNALDKMLREGVPTLGAIMFTTREPCLECAKSLCGLGLKAIYYDAAHDAHEGRDLLRSMGIPIIQRDDLIHEQVAYRHSASATN